MMKNHLNQGPFLGPTHDASAVTALQLNELMKNSCFFEGETVTVSF